MANHLRASKSVCAKSTIHLTVWYVLTQDNETNIIKCNAYQYLSLFSCNFVSHMTNYVNFKLSKDVEKNPGPTQYNTDHHEVIIGPFVQNHSSTMQLTSPISSKNLMQSRLGELGLQPIK